MFVSDLDYWSHRAEREAVAAASAGDHQIAAIHAELSRLYAEQVLRGLGAFAPSRAATRS
jgi:hypothetical protein